ncbi:MAG TPA: ATP-dependent Clp protease ATP-binding subunit [Treponemataceae bacterium]|nr:ATP-dependent Clp protease ATP-binding subunit [Treponemataceae bacterium]
MKGLSPRAQKLLAVDSQAEGRKTGSGQILPEHVMLSMIKTADGLGFAALQYLKINVLTYQLALEQTVQPRSHVHGFAEILPSRRLRNVLDTAAIESRSMRRDYVGTEHILLGIIHEEQSISYHFFKEADISIEDVRSAIVAVGLNIKSSALEEKNSSNQAAGFAQLFESQKSQQSFMGSARNARKRNPNESILAEFSRDLTKAARDEELDPVIGRKREIRRIEQILSRRTKNNPVLIGEPGVGKTAIVEGLALNIAAGRVPAGLMDKSVLVLDLALVIAGTKYRGEFEERIKRIMKEIKEQKKIILFIDEIHTMIGAGGSEGSMDASNMIKPALSRGELQCIGATTIKEYRKYFEKDGALERRFQPITVNEPSLKETREILSGIKDRYEKFHGVRYSDEVLDVLVTYSHRYLTDRFLPDKAIDLLDECGAVKKIDLQFEARPEMLKKIETKIKDLTEQKKLYVQEQDYEGAAEMRDELEQLRRESIRIGSESCKNSPTADITLHDVGSVISDITGIPSEQLTENEVVRLANMEKEIHKMVIGQDEAVSLISAAVRRSRAGVSSTKRPLGSFVFLGPTGVGKTLLAKTLATFLFGSEDALIRVDMSDFMEKHNASRLVGAPPGYIGFEDGGMLTEQVRRKPYSVVLLDEVEKAHSDVFNLLLQILEEGELRDGLGHTVNFKNTLVIMTSNAGAREISYDSTLGFGEKKEGLLDYEDIKFNSITELKKIMSPELLNRVDDIVVFTALSRDEVSQILDIQIADLSERLKEKNITIKIGPSARKYLIEKGYEPQFGARPMRRLIQCEIEDPLSLKIIEGSCVNGDMVSVSGSSSTNAGLILRISRPKSQKNVDSIKLSLSL